MKRELHKLLTHGSNKQYLVNGRSGIEEMERETTVGEMISFCKCSRFKYEFREKGVNAEDAYKVTKYEAYLEELECLPCYVHDLYVSGVWEMLEIKWDYGV